MNGPDPEQPEMVQVIHLPAPTQRELFGPDEREPESPRSSAVFSKDELHRYELTREWGPRSEGRALFIMLNPSKADAFDDDPTIRRCVGFARSWNLGGITVVNLFAFRATEPDDLIAMAALDYEGAVGVGNRHRVALRLYHHGGGICPRDKIVCAWSAHVADRRLRPRHDEVLPLLSSKGIEAYSFGQTLGGFPPHPLYLKRDLPLVRFGDVSSK